MFIPSLISNQPKTELCGPTNQIKNATNPGKMKGNEKEIPVQSEEVLDTTVRGEHMETFSSLLIYLRMKNSNSSPGK